MAIDIGFVVVVAALLTGIIQAVKKVPAVKAQLWVVPFVAIALGVGLGLAAWVSQAPGCEVLLTAVLSGLAAGLSAVGLYEVGKHTVATK